MLDGLCQISVSRFFRDRGVFAFLGAEVLPELAERALAREASRLSVWSAGCGSGEEPYSLAILWQLGLQARYPELGCEILATDANAAMIRRASRAAPSIPAWFRISIPIPSASLMRIRRPFRPAMSLAHLLAMR